MNIAMEVYLWNGGTCLGICLEVVNLGLEVFLVLGETTELFSRVVVPSL